MTYSIIQKTKLEGVKRLDAEYYQPEYLEVERVMTDEKSVRLGNVAFVTDGQHGYFKLDSESEIRQITAQHVQNGFINKANADRLSKETHEKNLRASLEENDVVLSTVGTVGNVGVVTSSIPPANLDQNVARIHLNNNLIDPWFLTVFLNSRHGQFQIKRNITGQVQQRLSLEAVRDLKIPILNEQKEIGEFLKDAYQNFENSKSLYQQAENLLLEELGLKDVEIKDELSNIVNFSDVKNANRMDAEYFQVKYEKTLEKIEKFKTRKLEELKTKHTGGFVYKSDKFQKSGVPLIRINNIKKGFLDLTNTAFLSEEYSEISKKDIARPGDILISMSGTIGNCSIVPGDIKKCCVNQRILSITSKNIEPIYLELFLNSFVGALQFEKIGVGGVQTNLSTNDVLNIQIPILLKATQEKIADLVKKSHEARKHAKELLEQAKQKVEDLIENKNA